MGGFVPVRSKSNIGPDDGGFEYSIVDEQVAAGLNATRVEWGVGLAGSARELLQQDDAEGDGQDGDDAEDFLREALADGTTPAKAIKKEAAELGISMGRVRRAAKKMGVVITKSGMKDGWYWRMPQLRPKVTNNANMSNMSEDPMFQIGVAPSAPSLPSASSQSSSTAPEA